MAHPLVPPVRLLLTELLRRVHCLGEVIVPVTIDDSAGAGAIIVVCVSYVQVIGKDDENPLDVGRVWWRRWPRWVWRVLACAALLRARLLSLAPHGLIIQPDLGGLGCTRNLINDGRLNQLLALPVGREVNRQPASRGEVGVQDAEGASLLPASVFALGRDCKVGGVLRREGVDGGRRRVLAGLAPPRAGPIAHQLGRVAAAAGGSRDGRKRSATRKHEKEEALHGRGAGASRAISGCHITYLK